MLEGQSSRALSRKRAQIQTKGSWRCLGGPSLHGSEPCCDLKSVASSSPSSWPSLWSSTGHHGRHCRANPAPGPPFIYGLITERTLRRHSHGLAYLHLWFELRRDLRGWHSPASVPVVCILLEHQAHYFSFPRACCRCHSSHFFIGSWCLFCNYLANFVDYNTKFIYFYIRY